jgi:TrmH family RNA methyltransferase
MIMKHKFIQLTSAQNEQFKKWKKLKTRKGREKNRSLLVEGEHLVLEAIRSQVPIRALIIDQKQREKVKAWNIFSPTYELSTDLFNQLVDTESPQGMIAEIGIKFWQVEELLPIKAEQWTFLLLDGIQDPGNLGTILRTAESAGVNGIFLGKGTVDPYNSKVVRAAMGSVFRLPLISLPIPSVIPLLQKWDVQLIGTSPHAGKMPFELHFPSRVAFVLGNEGRGIAPEHLAMLDTQVMIPMPGKTESLNVAVTGAMLLYERIRQQVIGCNV